MDNIDYYESIQLKEFYIFNPTFGNDHDDEVGKVLYYFPPHAHINTQLKRIGLCEAIIRFSENFNCETPCEALHTLKCRYVFYQPEPNYWLTIVLSVPSVIKVSPDESEIIDYQNEQVQDNVFKSVLLRLYQKFILRYNKLDVIFKNRGIDELKLNLLKSFEPNLKKITPNQCGLADIFNGLHFLPIDRLMFLKVQCFINQLLLSYPSIAHLLLLQGDKLLWSGVSQNDIQVLYDYLLKELLSEHFLSGASRQSTFGFIFKKLSHVSLSTLQKSISNSKNSPNDNEIYDPEASNSDSFKSAQSSRKNSKNSEEFLNFENNCRERHHMLIYKAEQSYLVIFLKDSVELESSLMSNLESFLSLKFSSLAKILSKDEGSSGLSLSLISPGFTNSLMSLGSAMTGGQLLSNSSLELLNSNHVKFSYFNNLNLAQKMSPGVQVDLESYRMLADLKQDISGVKENSEIIVKMSNDPWIVAKVSNGREFYAIFNNKGSNILEIDEEIKKLTQSHLSNIFFQD